MSIQVDLEPLAEEQLRAQAKAAGGDIETFVRDTLQKKLAESGYQSAPIESAFVKNLDEWIDLHPRQRQLADDGRESIYEGRGE
ncbi:MAG: hypothetical protein ABJZ55_00010 [Fuerstiella sp.]